MIVCHCSGVSDRTVRSVVRRGAADRRSVARECGAAAGCGGCLATVEQIIEQELRREPSAGEPGPLAEVANAGR